MNTDLVSSTYITYGLECHRPPDCKVCAGDTMKSSFISEFYGESDGALVCRLQRKQSHESTESSEDTQSATHLLVLWEISESKELYADVLLIEHDKGFNWNKDNLEKLYHKNNNRLRLCHDSAIETWLLDDTTALKTTFKIMNGGHLLDITLSEVESDNCARMPANINLERQVVLEIMIAIMLTHTISFIIQLPACVTIHNQCPNTKLVLPVYFGHDVVCPKLSNQQIVIGTAMKASFEINTTQCDFEGALLFRLQRYFNRQYYMDISAKDTNKSEIKCVQMLVAWKVKDAELFAYVVLVEHIREFAWNENKLMELYNKNHGRLKKYNTVTSDTWFMDGNMVLKTTLEIKGLKGDLRLSISISEEKDDYAIRPFYINLER
jgi:hypothetical protein